MKLSIGKAWEETSAFLRREAKLVAPVALATFALPAILGQWAFPAGAVGDGRGWIMLLALIVAMIGQMTVILLVNGWHGSVGEGLGKAASRLPTLFAVLVIVFLPIILIVGAILGVMLTSAGLAYPPSMTPESLARVPGIAWVILITMLLVLYVAVRIFPVAAVAVSETLGPIKTLSAPGR